MLVLTVSRLQKWSFERLLSPRAVNGVCAVNVEISRNAAPNVALVGELDAECPETESKQQPNRYP
jgi:hypothetical protein